MAFFALWYCVLVGSFSVSLAEMLNLSALYPPKWEESPGEFSNYTSRNGKYVINPWVYPERLGMYKILLNKTAKYFQRFGKDNEENLLWGLPLQHGWQYSSGRLADPTRTTDCGYESDPLCISEDSWWADMNYFLCVLPVFGAVDSGIMGISSDQVELLLPPKDGSRFCNSVSSCQSSYPTTMKKWKAFYQRIQLPSTSFDNLLKYLWDAHTSTVKETFSKFEDRYAYYSNPEVKFEKDWITVLGYFASFWLHTTLITIHEFQIGLPPRILVNGDEAPFIKDFSNFQNVVMLGLNLLYKVDSASGSSLLTLWKFLMNIPGAKTAVQLLTKIIAKAFTS
ncbi:protein LEG1 homolog [Sorex araneus]|uniref:protein LEG1 homolog n=1 Tax=Sorex araneus TaxID=42254 RepID=UPI002433833B|nr:protein LEG1 homolog [Sorex araneus]